MPDRYVPTPGHAPRKSRDDEDDQRLDRGTAALLALAALLLIGGSVCLAIAGGAS